VLLDALPKLHIQGCIESYFPTAFLTRGVPCRTFYDRLREVEDYHKRYPSMDVTEVRMSGRQVGVTAVSQLSVSSQLGACRSETKLQSFA
jgi:Splicing factor SF3a60 binding domain